MPMDDMNLKDAAFSGLYGVAFVALGRLLKMRTSPRPILRLSLLWELPTNGALCYAVYAVAQELDWSASKMILAWMVLGYMGPEVLDRLMRRLLSDFLKLKGLDDGPRDNSG